VDINAVIMALRDELKLIDQAILSLELVASRDRLAPAGLPEMRSVGEFRRSRQRIRARSADSPVASPVSPPA